MESICKRPSLTITPCDWLGINLGPSKRVMREIEVAYPRINVLWHDEFSFASYSVAENEPFELPDEEILRLMIRDYPWVENLCGRNQLAQFQAAYSFLSLCRKGKQFSNRTTYGIKHHVEDVNKIYVSEGAVILAAQFAGFDVEVCDDHGSCRLNLLDDDVYLYMLRVLEKARELIESDLTADITRSCG
jgi:hypothetical protein